MTGRRVRALMMMATVALAGPITSTPVTADGLVYVGAANSIFAYDATGAVGCSGSPKVCTPKWRLDQRSS